MFSSDDEPAFAIDTVRVAAFRAVHHVGQHRQFHLWAKEHIAQVFGADGVAGLARQHEVLALGDEVANGNCLLSHLTFRHEQRFSAFHRAMAVARSALQPSAQPASYQPLLGM